MYKISDALETWGSHGQLFFCSVIATLQEEQAFNSLCCDTLYFLFWRSK